MSHHSIISTYNDFFYMLPPFQKNVDQKNHNASDDALCLLDKANFFVIGFFDPPSSSEHKKSSTPFITIQHGEQQSHSDDSLWDKITLFLKIVVFSSPNLEVAI
jgi:hypothetical protein